MSERPFDELHRDEGRAGVLAELVHRDDVRMREPAGGLRLAAEAREDLRRVLAAELVGADGLERDDALDRRGRSPS